MVSTSARKAGDPWVDSRSVHDRFCASVSICSLNFQHRASLNFLSNFPMQRIGKSNNK